MRTPDEIDLHYAACARGALLVFEPIPRGSGTTLRGPGAGILSVDQALAGTPEGRFVEAHEIAHHELHPDIGLRAFCRGVSGSFFQREIDASDFGSRFLTPEALVRVGLSSARGGGSCRGTSLTLATAFADAFRVPLDLALMRLCDAIDEPILVAHTRAGRVQWWAAAPAFPFPATKGFVVGQRARACSREALAAHLAHGEPEAMPAAAWSKHRKARGAELLEHSTSVAGDGHAALSLLCVRG
jgi:hypothetical protein